LEWLLEFHTFFINIKILPIGTTFHFLISQSSIIRTMMEEEIGEKIIHQEIENPIEDVEHVGIWKGNLKADEKKKLGFFKRKNVETFYKRQNLLHNLFEDDEKRITQTTEEPQEQEEKDKKLKCRNLLETISLVISFLMNIIIFIIKLTAAVTSLSLSVIASTLDSFLGNTFRI
jgi:hypothetical protein